MHEQTEIYGYFNLQSKVTFVNANQYFWTFILGVSIIDDVIFFNFLITQKYQQEIWTKKFIFLTFISPATSISSRPDFVKNFNLYKRLNFDVI